MKRFVFATAVLLLVAAAGTPRAGVPADSVVLTKADRAFDEATATRGLEGFLSFLADDVATLRPDKPIITGKQAVGDLWAPLLNNPAIRIRWQPSSATISASGDFGYTIGTYQVTRTDEAAAGDPATSSGTQETRKRVVGTGKYVTIWRKTAAEGRGAWKVVFDAGVPDTPPQTAQKSVQQ